jgi:hypothetical protein
MLVEIDYPDNEGSVCPYCGAMLNVDAKPCKWSGTCVDDYNVKLYSCVCPQGHITFVSTETQITDDDYIFTRRMFAYYQDWEEFIDMTITPGAYEIPYLDDGDDAWEIHIKAVQCTQKLK